MFAFRTVLAAATALTLSGGFSLAQDETDAAGAKAAIIESLKAQSEDKAPEVKEFYTAQAPGQILATDLLGVGIYDASGAAVGAIDDVLFDEAGKLSVVIVDVSDLLGSDKRVAFGLADLRHEAVGQEIRLVAAISREALEAAPDFTSLSEEMSLNDGQSMTEEDTEGKPIAVEPTN